jgi:hypothetical protein
MSGGKGRIRSRDKRQKRQLVGVRLARFGRGKNSSDLRVDRPAEVMDT